MISVFSSEDFKLQARCPSQCQSTESLFSMDTGLWIVNSLCGGEMCGGTSTCWIVGHFPWLVSVSLENALRKFACLTTGDMIAINYNDRVFCSLISCSLILYSITGCLRWKNYMTEFFSAPFELFSDLLICWAKSSYRKLSLMWKKTLTTSVGSVVVTVTRKGQFCFRPDVV